MGFSTVAACLPIALLRELSDLIFVVGPVSGLLMFPCLRFDATSIDFSTRTETPIPSSVTAAAERLFPESPRHDCRLGKARWL